MNKDQRTSVGLKIGTRQKIREFGTMGDTYDTVIDKMITENERKDAKIRQLESMIYHSRQEIARLKEELLKCHP